jgi:hypothetical protein
MYLLYVDESGDDGLRGGTDWFVISGIIIHETNWNEVFDKVLELRRNLSNTFSVPPRIAFHATDIVNGHADFHHSRYGLDPYSRFQLYRQILEFLSTLHQVRLLNICIRKRLIDVPVTPVFEQAWELVLHGFQNFLEQQANSIGRQNDHGMLITDRTHDDQLRRMVRRFRENRDIFQSLKLIEDPVPREAPESYFVQMADLVAFAAARKIFPRRNLRAYSFETYFDVLKPILLSEDSDGIVYWP